MVYTVYKVTNKLNGKTYIGVHKTDNPMDSYMGSGKAIKNAISKHGIENFTKEILNECDTSKEAYEIEKELTKDFTSKDNYNMRLGGVGGFTKEHAKLGAESLSAKARSKGGKASIKKMPRETLVENGRKNGKANKGKPKRKIKCAHCDVVGSIANMKRWHFENCKHKRDGK